MHLYIYIYIRIKFRTQTSVNCSNLHKNHYLAIGYKIYIDTHSFNTNL